MSAIRTVFARNARLFSTSLPRAKVVPDAVTEPLKKVDRVVSDTIVKGIETGEQAAANVKSSANVNASQAEAKANSAAGEAQSEASKLAGQAQGKASEVAGQVKGEAQKLAGQAEGKKEELKGKYGN